MCVVSGGTVRVYVVVYNCDGPGNMGDGIAVARFKRKADAERFAAGQSCYSGAAQVTDNDVPRKLAVRWGVA